MLEKIKNFIEDTLIDAKTFIPVAYLDYLQE